jgi:hypothetical protein
MSSVLTKELLTKEKDAAIRIDEKIQFIGKFKNKNRRVI